MVDVKNLSFSYKNHAVLKDISFNTKKGEVIYVLGENGAGKTTLLKCILGFYKKYAGFTGEISLDGECIRNLSTKEIAKRIAYIPQAHEPTYNYTVRDIVLMGTTAQLAGFKTPGAKELAQVEEMLGFLEIAHLGQRGYAHLSGGERQLVLIARALVQKSKILVMDEPTASLDYGNQIKIMKQAKRLALQGYTVIISAHNPEHALHFSDKILIIDENHIFAYGDSSEILTSEVVRKIYGVGAEIVNASTSWGEIPLLAPRL